MLTPTRLWGEIRQLGYYLTQAHPGTVVEHANIRGRRLEYFTALAEQSRTFDPVTDEWYVAR